jgi:transcriptional regulator with XRE-family HTH domain
MTTTTDDALTKEIALRLRYVRESRGLSLAALSDLTGGELSKSRISNYEQGIRRMSIEVARMLADAFGTVSAAYLLCLDDPMHLTPDEIELIRKYRDTDGTGRAIIARKAQAEVERAAAQEVR